MGQGYTQHILKITKIALCSHIYIFMYCIYIYIYISLSLSLYKFIQLDDGYLCSSLLLSTVEMFIHMRFCWQNIAPCAIYSRRHQTRVGVYSRCFKPGHRSILQADPVAQERWKEELKEAKMEISCISAKSSWAKQCKCRCLVECILYRSTFPARPICDTPCTTINNIGIQIKKPQLFPSCFLGCNSSTATKFLARIQACLLHASIIIAQHAKFGASTPNSAHTHTHIDR